MLMCLSSLQLARVWVRSQILQAQHFLGLWLGPGCWPSVLAQCVGLCCQAFCSRCVYLTGVVLHSWPHSANQGPHPGLQGVQVNPMDCNKARSKYKVPGHLGIVLGACVIQYGFLFLVCVCWRCACKGWLAVAICWFVCFWLLGLGVPLGLGG